jgi:hypothetical protein
MKVEFEVAATADVMNVFYSTRDRILSELGIEVLASRYIGSSSFDVDPPFTAPGTADCVYLLEIEVKDRALYRSDAGAKSLAISRLCDYLQTVARTIPTLNGFGGKFRKVSDGRTSL